MAGTFQLKTAKNGKWFFNLLAGNGEVILTSQMYASKASAKKGIQSVQANAQDEQQFVEQENKSGKHYFVLKAKNHQTIGSSQAYKTKASMKKGIQSVGKSASGAGIVEEET